MEFELYVPNQDCDIVVDASGLGAKYVALSEMDKETIYSLKRDERVCVVPHAYSKVGKLFPGTYLRDTKRL